MTCAQERYGDLPIDHPPRGLPRRSGTFDAVVSIGLMEHVGPKNYRGYMELVDRCLAPGGVCFIHTIAGNRTARTSTRGSTSTSSRTRCSRRSRARHRDGGLFVVEDLQNIGEHYDRTLMAWWENFDAAWPNLAEVRPDVLSDVEVLLARLRRRLPRARDPADAAGVHARRHEAALRRPRVLGRRGGASVRGPRDVLSGRDEAEHGGRDRERHDRRRLRDERHDREQLGDRRGLADDARLERVLGAAVDDDAVDRGQRNQQQLAREDEPDQPPRHRVVHLDRAEHDEDEQLVGERVEPFPDRRPRVTRPPPSPARDIAVRGVGERGEPDERE